MDVDQFARPFEANKIHWRIGARTKKKDKAIPLAYIDARDVMKRLDDVCGVGGWQCRYDHVTAQGVVCSIGIFIGDEWIWKANGAGETKVEGEKGSMSDAFKRAAVLWGIGRYLYSVKIQWKAIDEWGKFTETFELPSWATPAGYDKLMAERKSK